MRFYRTALAAWIIIAILAVANGIFREVILTPLIEGASLTVSGLILLILIFLVAYLMLRRMAIPHSTSKLLKIGLLWVVLTIAFELIFGLAIGKSCKELLAAYDLSTGNLWGLIIGLELFIPLIVGKMLRSSHVRK